MKPKRIILLAIFSLFIIISCNKDYEYKKINILINSNEKDEIIKGYLLIGEKRDTSFIKNIFQDLNDQRVSHYYKHIGVSVYQSKMIAIKKISGVNPPKKITNIKDDSIIDFYLNWSIKNGYLEKNYNIDNGVN